LKKLHLHFMGIGGQGISAVAQMALMGGNTVTGCDRQFSATTRALQKVGIAVQVGHSAEHLVGVDKLVISPAVTALNPHNPELLEAQRRGIPVSTWQEVLGSLMQQKCVLSVSGVHGKGTTTAMLSLALVDAGLDPTCEIGAVVPRFGANYRLGDGKYFVNEADEFNHNFWHYHPRVAIVTSIEFEHPEFFADYEAFLTAFEHFIRGMDMQGNWPIAPTLVLNAGSPGCLELRNRLSDWNGEIVTYAVRDASNASHVIWDDQPTFEAYAITLDSETSFRVRTHGGPSFPETHVISLQLPGIHNIENALAALSVARIIGVEAESIVRTLEDFNGTRRRFEIRHQGPLAIAGRAVDVVLVDDYAHHPTAIAATLEAARRRYPGRRLIAVYQPHMYSRTQTFFQQFLLAFDAADVVIISDIYPAREQDTGLIHSRNIVDALANRAHFSSEGAQVLYGADLQNTLELLSKTLHSGDLAVIMGAGDIYTVTESLLQKAA
jgi:UDP-N-acetylmuramate--alanine ligase